MHHSPTCAGKTRRRRRGRLAAGDADPAPAHRARDRPRAGPGLRGACATTYSSASTAITSAASATRRGRSRAGRVDAACMIDGNHLLFAREGTLAPGATRVLAQTGPYDHCNFTVLDGATAALVERFRELLLAMSYDDPDGAPAARPRGAEGVATGPHRGLRVCSTARSTALGYRSTRGCARWRRHPVTGHDDPRSRGPRARPRRPPCS